MYVTVQHLLRVFRDQNFLSWLHALYVHHCKIIRNLKSKKPRQWNRKKTKRQNVTQKTKDRGLNVKNQNVSKRRVSE